MCCPNVSFEPSILFDAGLCFPDVYYLSVPFRKCPILYTIVTDPGMPVSFLFFAESVRSLTPMPEV